jgi:hypothetical protein
MSNVDFAVISVEYKQDLYDDQVEEWYKVKDERDIQDAAALEQESLNHVWECSLVELVVPLEPGDGWRVLPLENFKLEAVTVPHLHLKVLARHFDDNH